MWRNIRLVASDLSIFSLVGWKYLPPHLFLQKVGNKILRAGVSSISRDALPMAADAVPLVKKDGNVVDMRFVAESEAEFLLWNVGKQRAAEVLDW